MFLSMSYEFSIILALLLCFSIHISNLRLQHLLTKFLLLNFVNEYMNSWEIILLEMFKLFTSERKCEYLVFVDLFTCRVLISSNCWNDEEKLLVRAFVLNLIFQSLYFLLVLDFEIGSRS